MLLVNKIMAKDKDINELICKAKNLFGNKYDYSLVRYSGVNNPVDIKCNKHGVIFHQRIMRHLDGYEGCPECRKEQKHSHDFERFKEESIKLFGDIYDYSESIYVNSKTKIKVKCRICGNIFYKSPVTILRGHCCSCQSTKSPTIEINEENLSRLELMLNSGMDFGMISKEFNNIKPYALKDIINEYGLDTSKQLKNQWKYSNSNNYLDKEYIIKLLKENSNNLLEIRRKYGIPEHILSRKIKEFNIIIDNSIGYYSQQKQSYEEITILKPVVTPIENCMLPVPIKYYELNFISFIGRDHRRFYYIPEKNIWAQGSKSFLNSLKDLGIDFKHWELRWIFNCYDESKLYTDAWIEYNINTYYNNKPPHTKDFIRNELSKNYNYRCNFLMLKEDLIELFWESRKFSSIKPNYDFSYVPDKIGSTISRFDIIFSIQDPITGNTISEKFSTNYYKLINRRENPEIVSNRYNYVGESYVSSWIHDTIPCAEFIDKSTILGKIDGRNSKRVVPDFLIRYNNIIFWLERNGKQHYEEVPFFHKAENSFKNQLKRDNNVRDYCKKNNIKYIEIPYILDTYEKVKDFLDKVILQEVDPNILIDYQSLYKI